MAEPPPLPPSRRGAGSGVGRCGGRAIHRVKGWDRGTVSIPGVGVHRVESSASQKLGSQGRGQHLGGRTCPEWKVVSRELGSGESGQDSGVGGVPREEHCVSQELGDPGQRTGAGTSHRVLQQGAGGGRAPPCSRGAGRGRARVTRVRGDRGAGGAPGTPLSVPREDPPPRPTPRRALSRSRGRAMTRPQPGGGAAGGAPA